MIQKEKIYNKERNEHDTPSARGSEAGWEAMEGCWPSRGPCTLPSCYLSVHMLENISLHSVQVVCSVYDAQGSGGQSESGQLVLDIIWGAREVLL